MAVSVVGAAFENVDYDHLVRSRTTGTLLEVENALPDPDENDVFLIGFGTSLTTCDRPDAPIGYITSLGQEYRLKSIATGLSFKIIGFTVGCGGYKPLSPLSLEPADYSLTDLRSPVWPAIESEDEPFPVEEIDLIETLPSSGAQAFYMRLDVAEAEVGIGELALWAEVIDDGGSVADEDAVGTRFLFAVIQTPLQAKTPNTAMIFRAVFV